MPSARTSTLLLLTLLITGAVYAPGIEGFFVLDDISSIVNNSGIQIDRLDWANLQQAMLAETAGPFGRPLSALSFALNYYFASLDPWLYKLTNILIHLINGVFLWVFLTLLLRQLPESHRPLPTEASAIVLFTTAVWLLHPINLTGVLYVVQRMTSLATGFTLIGLCCYLLARTHHQRMRVHRGWLLGMLLSTFAATLCKENGLLLPALALLVEWFLFAGKVDRPEERRILIAFFVLTVALPVMIILAALLFKPGMFLGGYRLREFTLQERILTQPRVLWFHIGQLFLPQPSSFNLFHDGFPVSRNLWAPISTLPALIGLFALAGGALWLRARQPIIGLGISLFLVGHGLESTILPLEMVFEHRNYLPSIGLLLVASYSLAKLSPQRLLAKNRIAIAVIFTLVCTTITALRVQNWRSLPAFATTQVEHRPDSVRARHQLGELYSHLAQRMNPPKSESYYQLARENFLAAAQLQRGNVISLISLIQLSLERRQPVENRWIDDLHQRLSSAKLIAGSGYQLHRLFLCQRQGACPIDPKVVVWLVDAALSNPDLHRRIRSNVLFTRAYLHLHLEGDSEAAETTAREAVALYSDDLKTRLNLVELLIAMNHTEEAQAELAAVRAMDHHGAFQAAIQERAERLKAKAGT